MKKLMENNILLFIMDYNNYKSYFNYLENELKSYEEITSLKIHSTNRIDKGCEKRVYKVYYSDGINVDNLIRRIFDRVPVRKVTKSEDSENCLDLEAYYDKDMGPTET